MLIKATMGTAEFIHLQRIGKRATSDLSTNETTEETDN